MRRRVGDGCDIDTYRSALELRVSTSDLGRQDVATVGLVGSSGAYRVDGKDCWRRGVLTQRQQCSRVSRRFPPLPQLRW